MTRHQRGLRPQPRVRSQKSEVRSQKSEVSKRDPGGFIPPVNEFMSYQAPPRGGDPCRLVRQVNQFLG